MSTPELPDKAPSYARPYTDPRRTGYGDREPDEGTPRRFDCRVCHDTGSWAGVASDWELVPCPRCAQRYRRESA